MKIGTDFFRLLMVINDDTHGVVPLSITGLRGWLVFPPDWTPDDGGTRPAHAYNEGGQLGCSCGVKDCLHVRGLVKLGLLSEGGAP